MQRFVGVTAFLALVGLMAGPARAAELRIAGFFDNVFPHLDGNVSSWSNGGKLLHTPLVVRRQLSSTACTCQVENRYKTRS